MLQSTHSFRTASLLWGDSLLELCVTEGGNIMGFITRKVVIAGINEYPLRRAPGVSAQQIQLECAKGALEDAGLSKDDVDAYFIAAIYAGEMLATQEYMGIQQTYLDSTSI